ncbi:MAG: hypothetical protein EHM33_09375 [Chloroflexi bacterium]|nr:MAG: hypothetical protein EHM33_09375 [Chloroflexota bacterium]
MKKLIYSIFSALALAGLFGGALFSPAAAAPQVHDLTLQAAPTALSFAMLGRNDTLMRGPYSTTNLRFSLPANWAFQDGGSLNLILTAGLATDAASPVSEGQPVGASMSVTLNKKLIAVISLVVGTNVAYEIPIQKDALIPTLSDGRHDLELFLDASTDCDTENSLHQTLVMVSSASQFVLPYVEQAPVVDLTKLPQPIYQRDSAFPVNAILVVPDQPSEQEMQAALIVAASFGRLTGGKLPFSLLSSSQVTQKILTDSNLVFLGKASTLSRLQDVDLPAPLLDNAFNPQGIQADDGIMQMAVSPWNNGRSIVVVSGNTDAGVVKAAQALSYGNIQTVSNSNLAVVTDVAPPSIADENIDPAALAPATRTFKDLGYDVATIAGAGRSDTLVEFYVTPGFVASDGSYLDLVFNNSALLDFDRSGLTVFLNEKLIGGLRLSDETAATVTQRLNISPSLVLPGTNQLRIQADLAAHTQCSLANATDLWVSILPESSLHLPLQQTPIDSSNLQNLSAYPYPFVNMPTLSNTAFILSENDPASWAVASQIAYGFGNQAHGSILDLAVAYDGAVTDEIRNNRDLIVVGLPMELKLIAELKDSLPAPFEAGKNTPVITNQQVTYRFAPEASLGYLQLLAVPWNPSRTVLAVLGSTHAGIQMAGNTLTDPGLRDRLTGNFALINAENISVVDTRTGFGLGGIAAGPEVASQAVVPESAPASTTPAARPGWILPVVILLAISIVGVLVFALISGRRESAKS